MRFPAFLQIMGNVVYECDMRLYGYRSEFHMQPITDLNFGVKIWFLKPIFLSKMISAVTSIILIIYLFIITVRSADKIWKVAVGPGECIFSALMAFTVISAVTLFLFYFFRIFPDLTLYMFYASVLLVASYLLMYFIFAIAFMSRQKAKSAGTKIKSYINDNKDDQITKNFQKEIKGDENEYIEAYCISRTSANGVLLTIFSGIWLVSNVFLFFAIIFAGSAEVQEEESRNQELILH